MRWASWLRPGSLGGQAGPGGSLCGWWGAPGQPEAGGKRLRPCAAAASLASAARSVPLLPLLPVSVFTGRQALPLFAALCDPGFGLAMALFLLGTVGFRKNTEVVPGLR